MTIEDIKEIVSQCSFEDYIMHVRMDSRESWYLQGEYKEADIITGELEAQFTRRWALSPEMTKSEIVQTVFKMCLTSMEHRARENFLYRNRRVFGPHIDIDHLYSICKHVDVRV